MNPNEHTITVEQFSRLNNQEKQRYADLHQTGDGNVLFRSSDNKGYERHRIVDRVLNLPAGAFKAIAERSRLTLAQQLEQAKYQLGIVGKASGEIHHEMAGMIPVMKTDPTARKLPYQDHADPTKAYAKATKTIRELEASKIKKHEEVENRVLIKAQNVHDYWTEHTKEHPNTEVSDFFCVKPPFKHVLITYDHIFYRVTEAMAKKVDPDMTMLKNSVSNGLGEFTVSQKDPEKRELLRGLAEKEGRAFVRRVAISVDSLTEQEFEPYLEADEFPIPTLDENLWRKDRMTLKQVVERVVPASFLKIAIAVDGNTLPGRWIMFLSETGAVLTYQNDVGWVYLNTSEESAYIEREGISYELLQNGFNKHGATALATLQFMNCKNVEILSNEPSRQQRRQAEREGKKPPVTYKTLVIHPIGKRHVSSGRGEGTGISHALHIVRGHFKDYRSGNGLGRMHRHGIWWWSPQVRGSAECGEVKKDYEVVEK